MSNKDYQKIILEALLKKYNNRYANQIVTKRRIQLKPSEIYKEYDRNNADIFKKQGMNEAANILKHKGFITVDYLKFSEDIEKIYLLEENMNAIYVYLQNEYGIIPQNSIFDRIRQIVEAYIHTGKITKNYCERILSQLSDIRTVLVPERVEENLKMLHFLEENEENIYIREASMLVYGDSKWFENNNYEEICTALRNAVGMVRGETERNDAILNHFHVIQTEQEIFIKGKWKIEWEQHTLDIEGLHGGAAISSADVPHIKKIIIGAKSMMTIENKTSFQRLQDTDFAMMYLGGFAGRDQIEFLKKVISDNPDLGYYHFGDIDVGGFLIHKHLCRETFKNFTLYCMGVEQLEDIRFRHCLKELTQGDRNRMDSLLEEDSYLAVVNYMKEHNVKLEQEIVSYYLKKDFVRL